MEKVNIEKELSGYLKPGEQDVPREVQDKVEEVCLLVEAFLKTHKGDDFSKIEEALGLDSDYEIPKCSVPCYKIDPFDSPIIRALQRYLPHCETDQTIFISLPNKRALQIHCFGVDPRIYCIADDLLLLLIAIRYELEQDEICRQWGEEQEEEFWKNFKG